MRPRPVCTEQHLKDVSEALRQSQKPRSSARVLAVPEWSRWLLGFGLLAFALCFLFWLVSLPHFGGPQRELIDAGTSRYERALVEPVPLPAAPEVRRATLVRREVRRATLVKFPVGYHYRAILPDGTSTWTTYKGAVNDFSDLPLYPSLGDQWVVRRSGLPWIWMIPPATMPPQYYLGSVQGIPTWVDP